MRRFGGRGILAARWVRALPWGAELIFLERRTAGATMPFRDDEIDISFFRSRGPGGQKKNVTESAVRVRHIPTGIVVVATDSRSQHRNKAAALEELERRLAARRRRPKRRKPTKPSAASRRRRLEAKRLLSRKKHLRQQPDKDV